MNRNILRTFVLATAGVALCANSGAVTINFSTLSQPGTGSTAQGNSVTLQGFNFADLLNGGFGSGFSTWQASSPNLPGLSVANTSLFETFAGSTTRLTQVGNGAFNLTGIDLTQYAAQQPAGTFTVSFTGTRADSTTASQTVTVNRSAGTPALQSFVIAGFANVVRVDFTQGTASGGSAFQFDNVNVAAGTVPAVPEPSTFVYGTIALAGLFTGKKFFRRA